MSAWSITNERSAILAQYEISILFHPDLDADLEKGTKKVEKIFTDNGGKVEKTDNWGKKKLAYNIKGVDQAVYVFYTVELAGEAVRKVEGVLNITDEVIRFLIVKIDHKSIAKAEAIRAEKAKKQAERGENAKDDDTDDDSEA